MSTLSVDTIAAKTGDGDLELTGDGTGTVNLPTGFKVNNVVNSFVSVANTAGLGANTFTGTQSFADNILNRPILEDYAETVNAIGSIGGGTQDIDLTLGNSISATVDTASTTFTFSNPIASGAMSGFTLTLVNGGAFAVTWPVYVDWPGGTAPTLTTSGTDILVFYTLNGGTLWHGILASADSK
tara:strand:- start:2581 stop:3132 length:552 start_codon:yes stop_codon:yes gene_type:complete